MKLLLLNTAQGLIPCYDADFDEKRKLKIGQSYTADVKIARNIKLHRKFFSLINCAWEYLDENKQKFYKNNVNVFRKTVEIASGSFDPIWSIARKEWIEAPKSISFSNMDETEFDELYERAKDVLFAVFLTHITEEEFMRNLANY